MKLLIVAVKDTALQAYVQIFTVRAPGEAIRNFQDAINDPNSRMAKHSDDFELHELGTFEDNTGRLEPQDPKQIARGKDMVMREQGGITLKAQ